MTPTRNDDIAITLRRRMREAGINQLQLSRDLGYSRSWVAQELLGAPERVLLNLSLHKPGAAEIIAQTLGWRDARHMLADLKLLPPALHDPGATTAPAGSDTIPIPAYDTALAAHEDRRARRRSRVIRHYLRQDLDALEDTHRLIAVRADPHLWAPRDFEHPTLPGAWLLVETGSPPRPTDLAVYHAAELHACVVARHDAGPRVQILERFDGRAEPHATNEVRLETLGVVRLITYAGAALDARQRAPLTTA